MIKLIRIDDRLIHGQVMAVWARVLSVDRIIVADDATSADAFSQQIMRLAMPKSIRLTVCSVEEAGAVMKTAELDSSRTLVLLKDITSATRLYDYFRFTDLNVGGIGMMPGRHLLWRSIAASSDEVASLHDLNRSGVNVYLQMIPGDAKHPLPN